MIFFDVTKSSAGGHRSGLMRVNARLRQELGTAATEVAWNSWDRSAGKSDWFLTTELFSEAERPEFAEFLRNKPCLSAAIFHDAIPLRYPQITWPQSVARHPGYMKLLSQFDRVWAVSEESREDLLGFWRWQGIEAPPPVDILALGSDFNGQPRAAGSPSAKSSLLCVGIVEPRKNQAFLLDVCADLWEEGREFELQIVGRMNPHFGPPIVERIRALESRHPFLHYHPAADDDELKRLFGSARASVFPTIAEGCGLPLLESLWMGVPCVCSDLPPLRENADGGGCLAVPVNDRSAWKSAIGRILSDDDFLGKLAADARTRPLPTWAQTAEVLRAGLGTSGGFRRAL